MENSGLLLRLFLAINLAVSCFAQDVINLPALNVRGQVTSQGIDASSGTTKPAQTGTTLPGTCSVWQIFILTTATPGENIYLCTSSNTWTRVRMNGAENALTFTSPLSRATDTISLLGWGSGTRPVMAGALGTSGNCAQWGAAGLTDAGAPCGTGGGSGANALGYYLVNQSANAPANAINLGLLTSGLLKMTVSGGVATFGTAAAGTDYVGTGDSRLTDARTPTAHASSHISSGSDPIAAASPTVRGTVTSTTSNPQVVSTDDSRMTNARTPTAHAASHQHGGADEVASSTPISNGIPKAGSSGKLDAGWVDYSGYVPVTRTVNGKALSANITLNNTDVGALATTGNAVSSTKLVTPRAINGVNFDGTADISIPFSAWFLDAKANCGLVMDGTTDDTSALNTCINGLPAAGGQIRFPSGTAVINNLVVQRDNVVLIGSGASNSSGNTAPITKFKYTGTAGGFVIKWYKASTILKSGQFRGISIDANSLAATGLWLRNTDGFRAVDFSVYAHTGYGLIVDTASSIVGSCGDGSGSNFVDNFVLWSTAGGGLQLGNAGASNDVCSNKFGMGNITYSGLPGWHGLLIAHGDSNSFADLDIGSYGGKNVSSISCSSNVCTVTTASAHGLATTDGVSITGASSQALNGTHTATVTGVSTFTIPVTITNGSYTASQVIGASVQLGVVGCVSNAGTGCGWNNTFGKLLTTNGIHKFPNAFFDTLYPNHVSQWNWTETSGGNLGYARMSGVAGMGVDGSLFQANFRTTSTFEPPAAVQYGFIFKPYTILDYGVAFDFINATPVSTGYYPLRMHNNTQLASTNAAKSSNIEIVGVDSDDNIRLGSTFNPSGTMVKVNSRLKFGSLSFPTCNASTVGVTNFFSFGGASNDIYMICIQQVGGSYAWKDLIN